MKRICIISQTHLAYNPRVVKEANSLQASGYEVTVLTVLSSEKALGIDKKLNRTNFNYRAGVNLIATNHFFRPLLFRSIRKAATKLYEYFKIHTPHSIMYGPYCMLKAAKACKADLYIGHTEAGLWVCNKLAKSGHRVALDFEDWYSQDYLSRSRPVSYLRELEKCALTVAKYITCPSAAMAGALASSYGQLKPHVLYNGFSNTESDPPRVLAKKKVSSNRISLTWFSQTIGPGRGLELLLEALNSVNFEYELHLRGKCESVYTEKLLALHKPKTSQELFIHAPVPHMELLAHVSQNDVGLALEQINPPSRNYTITNKILQYLQAGLVVISTETEGQREVANLSSESIFLFENNNIDSFVKVLNRVNELYINNRLDRDKSYEAFQRYFSWEIQEKKLLCLVAEALV